MSNTENKPSNMSDKDSPTDSPTDTPQRGMMTINMTYARLALLLVALNLLFTGYAIVRLDSAASGELPVESPVTVPADHTDTPERPEGA